MGIKLSNLGPTLRSKPSTPESDKTYDRVFGDRKPAYLKSAEELVDTFKEKEYPKGHLPDCRIHTGHSCSCYVKVLS